MSTLLNPQYQFRPMQLDDLDAIMTIEPLIYTYPWTRGNFKDSLNAGYSCWVYNEGNRIIGYAVLMLVLDESHLLNLSIAKGWQGRGLGRSLLEEMMKIAHNHGAQNMFLEVRMSNKTAVHLYENVGFNEMAIRRDYYPAKNGREDAILMGAAL